MVKKGEGTQKGRPQDVAQPWEQGIRDVRGTRLGKSIQAVAHFRYATAACLGRVMLFAAG
jgi:hypothetical protein